MTLIVKEPTTAMMLIEARVISINCKTDTRTVKMDNGVSLEALQVNFVHKRTVEKLQQLWGTTSAFIGRLFTNTPNTLAPSLDLSRVIRLANNSLYLNDKDIKVTVPDGMSTSYLEYTVLLEEMVNASVAFYDDTLLPFKGWVGACLNDPTQIESIRGNTAIKIFNPEDLIKQREKAFKGHGSEVKYGQAFKRGSDWQAIQERLNGLLVKMAGQHSPMVINDAVLRLDESIGLLITALVDPQKTYNASPKNVEALALQCYNLAKMIEFYGLTCYSIQSCVTAVNSAAEKFTKARSN